MSATVQLAQSLAARGHTVTLLTFDAPEAPFLRELPPDLRVVCLGPSAVGYGFIIRLEARLAPHARAFDFLILNGLWLHSTAGVARWARRNQLPYALFPHGMLDPFFARAYPFKHLKKLIYWFLVERHTVADARALLYTTPSELKLAQHTFPFFHPQHQEVIGLGLESSPTPLDAAREAFLRAFPALRGRSYLLYLGRFHPKKGADLLLKAIKNFPTLTLVMAGPLQDTHPKFLNKLMSASSAQVIWTDLLTGPAKWGALAGAQAFILPSHQENFGMAAAEALSAGTPVLISDQVAIADDVLACQAGFVAHDTLEGTHSLLEKFCALSPEEKSTLRTNARACYQKNHLPDAVAQKLEKLIQQNI